MIHILISIQQYYTSVMHQTLQGKTIINRSWSWYSKSIFNKRQTQDTASASHLRNLPQRPIIYSLTCIIKTKTISNKTTDTSRRIISNKPIDTIRRILPSRATGLTKGYRHNQPQLFLRFSLGEFFFFIKKDVIYNPLKV